MIFLNRKQLLLTAILCIAGEILVTAGLLLTVYMGWLDNLGQNIILFVFFPIVSLAVGWLSRLWANSWFVALLAPLLIFTTFILVSMDNLLFMLYIPFYMALSFGGYYLYRRAIKKNL